MIHRRERLLMEYSFALVISCSLAAMLGALVIGGRSLLWVAATAILWLLSALWAWDCGQYLMSVLREPWRR